MYKFTMKNDVYNVLGTTYYYIVKPKKSVYKIISVTIYVISTYFKKWKYSKHIYCPKSIKNSCKYKYSAFMP